MLDQIRYTLLGHVPSKKNSKRIYCMGKYPRVLPSEAYETWHKDASLQLKMQKPKLINTVSLVHLKFYAKNKSANDLSNKAESVMDLLVDMKVLEDDSWHIVPKLDLEYCGVDKMNPRCEIIIYF